ncbi:hypothetical protein MJM28_30550, partial [Salmonella enterica subsp. enterica serovar Montevideo]|nr:hypothetical protein [Salmonella enterica subsp. enterica serovar Montevideo]
LEKNMPIGSGLGSSACSVVAALVAMNEHCGKPLNDTRLLALMSICISLRAFGYVSAWGCKTISEAIAYRENFSQRELMVIWPDF